MNKITVNRGGYRQVPILAGKSDKVKPKVIDISSTIIAGASHGTMNQGYTFVLVVNDDSSKK